MSGVQHTPGLCSLFLSLYFFMLKILWNFVSGVKFMQHTQTRNHENRSVLWPWHSLGSHKQEMWDLSAMRFAHYEAQIQQKMGWINRSCPPLLQHPPPLQVAHTGVLQRKNTKLDVFIQGLFIFSLGKTAIPSQWCQLIQGALTGRKIKNPSSFQSGFLPSKCAKCSLLFHNRHLGKNFSWFLRDAQCWGYSEEINLLMHAEREEGFLHTGKNN